MRHAPLGFFLLMLCASVVCGAEPEVESIDYANPNRYLDFPHSLGNRTAIEEQASKLKSKTDLETIGNVLAWMDQNLKHDGTKAYQWRNYDDVLRERAYGGCADQGIVCGVLLKGAGIPVVWVKTMDVSWIWDFKKGRPFQSWSGHVFLEVFVNGKWALLNPGAKIVYQNYSPKMRILPGNRFAYHKGNDPKAMIMSLQWGQWKQQTEQYFRDLDESLLPVDDAGVIHLVPQAFVIGNSPYYQTITQMAVEAGFPVAHSFNTDYDVYLPKAQGHLLLIETHQGKPIIPLDILEKYFPNSASGLLQPSGFVRVKDTSIIFLDFSKQLQSIKDMELKQEKGTEIRDQGSGQSDRENHKLKKTE
ncbi:MAG TPA: transglutaminase domain-containing protein [Thermoguttaceae bacterium]